MCFIDRYRLELRRDVVGQRVLGRPELILTVGKVALVLHGAVALLQVVAAHGSFILRVHG